MHREWWRLTSGEKEELLKGGVDKQRWQQGDKCSMRVGWMNNTTRDPTMFAAASDTAVGRVVEFKAVVQNYSMLTFDVTSAYTHAWEDELVFLEPPPEEIEEHGDFVWRSIRVIYGRRARVQDRGKSTLTPSSEVRKHGSEVSQWNHIQSVRHFSTCVRPME